MVQRIGRRRLNKFALAGLIAAPLAACHKQTEKPVLTLGDQKGGMQSLLQLSGALENLNYQIKWAEFADAALLFEALNAGAIDAGIGGDAPFVFFLVSKPRARAIAALNYTNQNQSSAAILVRRRSPITSIADLRGKRVAVVRGSTGHYVTLAALRQAGLPLNAVTFTFLDPSDSISSLSTGAVDAWATWEPYVAAGELHDGLRPLPIAANLLAGLGFIVATDKAIANKQLQLTDFISRFGRARDWAAANRAAFAAGFAKDTGVPADVAAAYVALDAYQVAKIDAARIATVQQLADLYADAGLLQNHADISYGFDRDFPLSTS
jgi:sulfonate transport system substrate-binding protein